MKRKFVYSLTAMAAATVMTFGVFSLAACGDKLHTHIDEDGNGKCDICDKDMPAHTHTDEDGDGRCDICKAKMEKPLTDEPLNATTVIADFTAEGENEEIYASDGWSNMGSFNCEWDTGRVAFEDGYAKLTIAENPDGSEADCNEYFGGEMRTRGYYGYGDYEVSMKPAKKVGTASTFFVCTGDYDYQPGSSTPNPWDEVDIEFLGQDTTKVQFNYFVNGVGTGVHEYVYDLGFDASEDFHTYGFRWAEDHITWFVDGEPVYRVDASADNPMPSTAGRMLMNYWCGNSKGYGWMGQYSDPGDEGAEYQWIKTSAAKAYDESEAGPPAETPDIEGVDFTDVDMSAVGAASDAVYAVTKAEDAFNVTYTDLAGNYQNVAFNGMNELAQANNLFRASITNNGTETVSVRIDVMSTEKVNEPAPDQFMYVTNLLAMQDGEAVTTDLEWGGSLFTVEAGATVEIVIEYDNSYPYSNIQFMIDSHLADGLTHSGNVTIGGFAFGANDNASTEVRPPEPDIPDIGGVEFEDADLDAVTVGGNTDIYTTEKADGALNITYGEFAAGYQNVDLSGFAAQQANNLFRANIANNGSKAVSVRIDIMATFAHNGNTAATNLRAMQDGVQVPTDTQWGGSTFTVEPDDTIEIVIEYDNKYQQASVQFMLDSASNGTPVTGGDVTKSGLAFGANGNVYMGETVLPPEPVEPSGDSVNLTFTNAGPYTVDTNGTAADTVNVTYTAAVGNSYLNIRSDDAAQYAAGNDTFTVTITNNGTDQVRVRIDIMGTTPVDIPEGQQGSLACNVSHTVISGAGAENIYWEETNTQWGGTTLIIAPGKTITVSVKYDGDGAWGAVSGVQFMFDSSSDINESKAGNVTLSNFIFSDSTKNEE